MRQPVLSVRVPCLAIQPLEPLGRPGSITCSHATPPALRACPITGNVVRSPVIGRTDGTVASTREPRCGRR